MDATELLGYSAALLVLLTFSMKTMVPLRVAGILSNLFFIAYGFFTHANPILILHAILLPLNGLRLVQILSLVRRVEDASRAAGEADLEWMQMISKDRVIKTGEILFKRGDVANSMYFVLTGRFRINELGVDVGQGEIIGELGLLAPNKARTQSAECVADGRILEITYDRVKQLYFQSPKFGFFFLQLASRRLFENLERQDRELGAYRAGQTRIT
ncbi:MAG TPA: Crp/Fnr family transcriptional regulator [Rudaea sp.]|jgi:hypothetical protein